MWGFVIYEFFSCSTNIPRGLLAYKPRKLVVYCLNSYRLKLNTAPVLLFVNVPDCIICDNIGSYGATIQSPATGSIPQSSAVTRHINLALLHPIWELLEFLLIGPLGRKKKPHFSHQWGSVQLYVLSI